MQYISLSFQEAMPPNKSLSITSILQFAGLLLLNEQMF